jgi:NAD-dependent deacetylase
MEPASGAMARLAERLSEISELVVITGSGVSRESGVPTFRGDDGLWNNYRAEELATRRAFETNPALVWSWYDYRRQLVAEAEPNPAHLAIVDLENNFPGFSLITQNTDGLHDRAGNRAPIELHGNIWRARCTHERTVIPLTANPLPEIPPKCSKCGSLLRPDVVWYGEPLPVKAYERSHELAARCEAMLVVGTSAIVHPAASLPLVAKHSGALVVEVNTSFTPVSALVDATLLGRAGEVLPELVRLILPLLDAGNGVPQRRAGKTASA